MHRKYRNGLKMKMVLIRMELIKICVCEREEAREYIRWDE